MYAKYVKRPLDFVLALSALVLILPLLIVLSITGAVFMGGNPFFVQPRPGKKDKNGNEKIFNLIKFRTMSNKKDKNGELLPDEQRLNKYGRFLRSTSLDELPELLNILLGQLSIVGPRPLLVQYLPYYTEEERRRHNVLPGLTGYSQVHGRNYVKWEDKFKMDVWYVDNISFVTDFKILLDTVKIVFKRENIETASSIIHDGVLYQPLDVERSTVEQECV